MTNENGGGYLELDEESLHSQACDMDSKNKLYNGLSGSVSQINQKGDVHFKILVPSIAAGAIIGKGGEAITNIQNQTAAKVKMSKANDFYPGTSERVCLIIGTIESILRVFQYISEKISEKPDSFAQTTAKGRIATERHKQVKILVPNSTAGIIIGKGGNFIREIKNTTGVFIQVSQKSKEYSLTERCVTIAGEPSQLYEAVAQLLVKIAHDPQSASCPNISYSDVAHPVANAYPTGSPYALTTTCCYPAGADQTVFHQTNSSSSASSPGLTQTPRALTGRQPSESLLGGSDGLAVVRQVLRGAGYSELATEEIAQAMHTLSLYGFISMSSLTGSVRQNAAVHNSELQQHHHQQQQQQQQQNRGNSGAGSPVLLGQFGL